MTTLYQLLEVARDADQKTIERAFRHIALKYHPDKTQGDEEATIKFKQLVNARDTLLDPQKRKIYDATIPKNPPKDDGKPRPGHAKAEADTEEEPYYGAYEMPDTTPTGGPRMYGYPRKHAEEFTSGDPWSYTTHASEDKPYDETNIGDFEPCRVCGRRKGNNGNHRATAECTANYHNDFRFYYRYLTVEQKSKKTHWHWDSKTKQENDKANASKHKYFFDEDHYPYSDDESYGPYSGPPRRESIEDLSNDNDDDYFWHQEDEEHSDFDNPLY